MTITQEINLDVSRENAYRTIMAKQYDENSRFLKVTVLMQGEQMLVDKNLASVTLTVNRPDKSRKNFLGVVNDDGTVTVPLPTWLLLMEGTATCTISIIGDTGTRLSTLNFTVLVEKTYKPDDEEISDDPKYDLLTALVSNIGAVEHEIQANEKARVEAEKQRVTESAQAVANAEAATVNANNAAQQAASAVLAGGFIPIYDEDDDKNYNYQIVIRNGYPVLTATEITE